MYSDRVHFAKLNVVISQTTYSNRGHFSKLNVVISQTVRELLLYYHCQHIGSILLAFKWFIYI